MPIQMTEQSPYVYKIETMNERGEKRIVKTNLYFLGKILKEMNKGFSPMILVVGKQRMGKSFVGLLISYMIMRAFNKADEFDPKEISYYEARLMIQSMGDVSIVPRMLDEAGAVMGRREWFDQTHRALEKIIQTQGYKTLLYLFISPFASDLDKIFIKHFDFIVRVDYRGKFKVFKTVKRYDEINDKRIIKYFLDEVTYNLSDLPGKLWEEYHRYSIEEKEKLRLKYSRREDTQNKAVNTVISNLKRALKEAS